MKNLIILCLATSLTIFTACQDSGAKKSTIRAMPLHHNLLLQLMVR
jgi:hypothetical protein